MEPRLKRFYRESLRHDSYVRHIQQIADYDCGNCKLRSLYCATWTETASKRNAKRFRIERTLSGETATSLSGLWAPQFERIYGHPVGIMDIAEALEIDNDTEDDSVNNDKTQTGRRK